MLVEPTLGDEKKYPELMKELERPMSGTPEARRAETEDILGQFGISMEAVRNAQNS